MYARKLPISSMRRLVRKAAFILGSWYHHAMASRLVWWHLSNAKARRAWTRYAEPLTPQEQAIVDSIRRTGIAVAHIDNLLSPVVFAELRRYAAKRWNNPEIRAVAKDRERAPLDAQGVKKSFLVSLWEGEHVLDFSHPFIRLSVSAPLLRIVGAYLGLAPKFRDWRLEVTVPTPEGMRPRASQRWHRDQEDQKLIKVFLYLSDVDEAAGPFMYVQYAHPVGKWRNLFPRIPPRGSLPMPEDVDRHIPWDDVVTLTGRAGTIIFCDTSGLHQGGYAKSTHRLMYTSIYTTAASPWPIRYAYPPGFTPLPGSHGWEAVVTAFTSRGLGPLAAFAVDNNPRQRPPKYFR